MPTSALDIITSAQYVKPANFGYEANGTIAEKSAAMLSFASSDSPLKLMDGVFEANVALPFKDGVVKLLGELIYTGTADIDFVTALGSQTNLTATGVSIAKGNNILTVPSTASLSIGQSICVQDLTPGSFQAGRPYYYEGEYFVVQRIIDATTLELTSSANAAHTNSALYTRVERKVYIENGGRISDINAAANRLVYLNICRESKLDIIVHGANRAACDLSNSHHCEVEGSYTQDVNDGGTSYGFVLGGSSDNTININAIGGRHGFTIGGGGGGAGVCRRNVISGSFDGLAANSSAFDFHGYAEDNIVKDFVIHNGSTIAGASNRFKNGTFRGRNKILVDFYEMVGGHWVFDDITFESTFNYAPYPLISCGATSYGMDVNATQDFTLEINGGSMKATGAHNHAIHIDNKGTTQEINVEVRDMNLDGLTINTSFLKLGVDAGTASSDFVILKDNVGINGASVPSFASLTGGYENAALIDVQAGI